MVRNRLGFLLAGCSATALLATAAHTQEEETSEEREVIVVTATKREQTLQDVPFSVNALTGEDLDRVGATNLDDIARNVAGLTVQNLGPGQSQIAIRGVASGQIVRDQPGVKEQVGIYLDESVISLSLFNPDLDLFDLERVETLRGPQGTLFGSGSIGGTIRYITKQPTTDQFEGVVEADINTVSEGGGGGHLKGAVNIPISDTLAVRAVGYLTEYAGFIDAVKRNEDGGFFVDEDVNRGQRNGGRIALNWRPNDRVSITPRILYQDINFDGFNRQESFNIYANPNTFGVDPDGPQPPANSFLRERQQFLLLDEAFADETLIADLTATIDLGFADLTTISSYTDRQILVSRDASALTHSVSLDLGLDVAVTDIPSNLRDTTEYEAFTQEVRLSSNNDGPFQWLVGAFYADLERDYAQRLPTPGYDAFTDAALGEGTSAAVANGFPADSPFNSDLSVPLEQIAVFGEASLDVTDRLTVTAGGRYYDFEEDRLISSGGLFANGDTALLDSTSSDGFTPRVIASYDVNEIVTVNAQASQGFRLGGVNDPLNPALCNDVDLATFGGFQTYDDETLWNYEVGVKAERSDFTINTAVFYTDITDLQVTLDAGSCSSRVVFNVPEAFAAGVEYEVGYFPTDNLELYFSGSFVEAEFQSTVTTFVEDGAGGGQEVVVGGIEKGNRLPTVPEFQFSASAVHYFGADWLKPDAETFLSASLQYVGTRFTQPSDQIIPGQGLPTATGLAFGGFDGTEDPSSLVDLELDDYTIINLRGGLDLGNLEIAVYANNIFDENALFSFDRERGGRARLGFNVGQPRTFGVTARRRF